MKRPVLLFALLLLACLGAGWLLLKPGQAPIDMDMAASGPSPGTPEQARLLARIDELEAALAEEKARNAVLEQRLQTMQADGPGLPETDTDTAAPTDDASDTPHAPARSSIPTLESLTGAGIRPATAEAIRDKIADDRLAMLNLRDRAEREGWLNSARYSNELRKLLDPTHGIREQYGDDVYDRYLFATGKPNRVVAADVYPDSSAAASGIQPNDVVLSYAGTGIYAMNDLKQATLEGEAGESVLVVLQRDNETYSITVPRGPLGIEMRTESHAPE